MLQILAIAFFVIGLIALVTPAKQAKARNDKNVKSGLPPFSEEEMQKAVKKARIGGLVIMIIGAAMFILLLWVEMTLF